MHTKHTGPVVVGRKNRLRVLAKKKTWYMGRATHPRVCSRERFHRILVLQLILVRIEWRLACTQKLAG